MAEVEQTQIVTRAHLMDLVAGDRLHSLELLSGNGIETRHVITELGVTIGRTAPADMVIADSNISRSHCIVLLQADEIYVLDRNSTNGTFIDGVKIAGQAPLPVGSTLQVGTRTLKHEWRTRAEFEQLEDEDRDLQRAASYVHALLPPPQRDGPIRTDWVYQPSAKLGGDTFGYGQLSEHLYACYLIDVAGHGAGAAMHAVAVTNMLRQKTLPDTDMSRPDQVLGTLNGLFQMEDHDGFYFTIWYGVYDTRTRQLDFASGGHHAGYLLSPDRETAQPLRTRNVVIGAKPGANFTFESVTVPHGASCYIFSDGVYEIVDRHGREWGIDDFVAQILKPPLQGVSEPQRLFAAVCEAAGSSTFEDDFSLVVFDFV